MNLNQIPFKAEMYSEVDAESIIEIKSKIIDELKKIDLKKITAADSENILKICNGGKISFEDRAIYDVIMAVCKKMKLNEIETDEVLDNFFES